MRQAGRIAATALKLAGQAVRVGITTKELDTIIRKYIRSQGAQPSFLGYGGFPASACISVDEEVIHGIPGPRALQEGNIVSIDVGAYYKGYHGDCANTFPVGSVAPQAMKLIEVTRQSFYEGLRFARAGMRLGDLGAAIQQHAEAHGFSVVRVFVGHGVGRDLHEDPNVPNVGNPGKGLRLEPGMTIAIEPMINEGVFDVRVLSDEWTVVTTDGKRSAHYENTVLVTQEQPEILTLPFEGEIHAH